MVQFPEAISDAVASATVQTVFVVDTKLTGNPELAVADKVSVVPAVWLAMATKVMLWLKSGGGCSCRTDPPHPAMNRPQIRTVKQPIAQGQDNFADESIRGMATKHLSPVVNHPAGRA
jgi:hypothetical protein